MSTQTESTALQTLTPSDTNESDMNLHAGERFLTSRKRPPPPQQLWKRVVPHVLLVLGVVLYLLIGAAIFEVLQESIQEENPLKNRTKQDAKILEFMSFVRERLPENESLEVQLRLEELMDKLYEPKTFDSKPVVANDTYNITDGKRKEQQEGWKKFSSSILFAFTAVSTIGYGHIYPTTTNSRLFCIIYTLIGIPLFMITVADIGKFLWEAFAWFLNTIRTRVCCCLRRKPPDDAGGVSGAGDLSLSISVPLLTFAFGGYIVLGALLLPHWEKMDFFEASYFCFISVTTVGFGDVVPENTDYLLPTLLYIFFGLALTTLAIEVLAAAFRRVHYLGTQIKGAEKAKVWFGNKMLSLNDLVRSIGREMGATEEDILKLGQELDQVLEEAVNEIEETGAVTVPNVVSDDGKTDDKSAILEKEKDDKRRFSGGYDNIPESWVGQNLPYMDEDLSLFLAPLQFTAAMARKASSAISAQFV